MLAKRTFPARPEHLGEIRRFILDCATADSFTDVADDLLIAASEASANAMQHARSRIVIVTWTAGGNLVELTIDDEGVFMPAVGVPELDGVSHRGILLMMATMDEVTIAQGSEDRPGTRVKLVKRKPELHPAGASSSVSID